MFFDLAAYPWTFLIVILTVLLGLGIAYGMMRNRTRTPAEKATTEAATRRLYDKEG